MTDDDLSISVFCIMFADSVISLCFSYIIYIYIYIYIGVYIYTKINIILIIEMLLNFFIHTRHI